jgi:transcriptional regulator of met regulon
MEIESIKILWAAVSVLTITFFIKAKSKSSNAAMVRSDTEEKKQSISNDPIQNRVDRFVAEQANIKVKMETGKPLLEKVKSAINTTEEDLKYINVGLLPPVFKFDDCESLKGLIAECYKQQYKMIKGGRATVGYTNWFWNGDTNIGKVMVRQYRELLLRAFNSEFDFIRKQMRHSTHATAVKKLYKLAEQLEKLGEAASVAISRDYIYLKEDELRAWHYDLIKKENTKKERKKQQQLLREQAKQGGEDTEELEDDIYYRKSDLDKARKLAKRLHGANAADMEDKIAKMQKEIEALESKFERATSQAQITKAGYIYVISNIGSFGEGVVKIGMTRRLEPMDRVQELGDASVPFKFDVHTLTFVDNAPSVEKALHHKFEKKRVNKDNLRKEFFKVSPQEVAEVMKELGIEADWYFDVEAKEYKESLLIREARSKHINKEPEVSAQLPNSI